MDKEAQEKIVEIPKNPYAVPNLSIYGKGKEAGYTEAQEDMLRAGYRKLPKDKSFPKKDKPPLARNAYTSEYKYLCSEDAGMPISGQLVNDDAYVAYGKGQLAQREADIEFYTKQRE